MSDAANVIARIDYLVRRRFPNVSLLRVGPSYRNRTPPPEVTKLRRDVEAYLAELLALHFDELFARYNAEQTKERDENMQRREREERERFYNQPHALADNDHWSKAAHWTLDEAIALSFGKAPEIVRWDELQKFTALGSPFVAQYARRRDLALRAKTCNQLYDPVLPGFFLAWAKRADIPVPAGLTEAVQKRGVQVADWKNLHDEAVEARKRDVEAAETLIADWKRLLDKVTAQLEKEHRQWLEIDNGKNAKIEALEAEIEALQSRQPASKPEREIGARERDSLLKLIIGMAVAAYAYDPKATRSDKTTEIANDLADAGVPLDVDTVRKWLREAAELLPPK